MVVAMIAFLRKAERQDVLRYVHAGWVLALAAGGLTWFAATHLVSVSGASRELTEGFSSLFAAVVLLGVGMWMHQKSVGGRWQIYLKEKLSNALNRKRLLSTLFLLKAGVQDRWSVRAAMVCMKSRLFRRLKSGPHGRLVELYAARLVEVGLAGHSTWRCLNVVGDLLAWMASRRAKLINLDERMVERYLRHRGEKQTIQSGDRAALKRWLLILRTASAIAPAALPVDTPHDQIFAEFSDYLRTERGLAAQRQRQHDRFLQGYIPIAVHVCAGEASQSTVGPNAR